ncbi:MAG: hypothetical protein ABSF83_03820 [Nitrososphaerales archaeon]
MEYQTILGTISAVLVLVGFLSYFKEALFGGAKAHAFSWLIWGVLNAIVFLASTSKGAGAGAWAVGASGGLNFIIFGIALFKGEKEITLSDKACLLAALLGIAVWVITTDPLWSVIVLTVVDMVGFIPTYRKAYKRPAEESVTMFILTCTSYFISLFALQTVNLVTFLYPASLVVTDAIFVLLVLYRRRAG